MGGHTSTDVWGPVLEQATLTTDVWDPAFEQATLVLDELIPETMKWETWRLSPQTKLKPLAVVDRFPPTFHAMGKTRKPSSKVAGNAT